MIKKICGYCGKKFLVHPYRELKAHFCSTKCYNTYRARTAYPVQICPQCKKEFSINRETRHRKYCSPKCWTLGKRKYNWRDKICSFCHKKFHYNPKNHHQKFCNTLCQHKNQAHKVNERFFQKINNQERAYLLGLIFSDGSISHGRLRFCSKDKELVQLFKRLLDSSAPVYSHKNQNSFLLTVSNATIYSHLKNQGVVERKSWKEYGVPLIPESLMWHFIRGVFDGDGSFYISNRGKLQYLCVSLCCNSYKFLREIKKWLGNHDIKTHNIRFDRKPNNTGSWQLRIARKEAVKHFASYLYKDSKHCLDRKYKIVKNFYEKGI